MSPLLDAERVARLYRSAAAARWGVSVDAFADALEASVAHAFAGRERTARAVDGYLATLHLADLALACACIHGNPHAWEVFVAEYRPVLYRAADALDRSGGAREIADGLYAEIYERRLLAYFHGRSTLATWLRAVLSQRYVDRIRAGRRYEPLPSEETPGTPMVSTIDAAANPDRTRLLPLILQALHAAVARLPPHDRLRLQCYYAQELTLAQIGRLLEEHEATASRQLARCRRVLREDVERQLREEARLSAAEIALCFQFAAADPGALDIEKMLARKNVPVDRSS